jgi:hypothetical protein
VTDALFLQEHLPFGIEAVTQYFGSFVKITGTTSDGGPAHIRIYLCDWSLVDASSTSVRASSAHSALENQPSLDLLVGARITSVETLENGAALRLDTASNLTLVLRANADEYALDDDMLLFYSKAGCMGFNPTVGWHKVE